MFRCAVSKRINDNLCYKLRGSATKKHGAKYVQKCCRLYFKAMEL